MGIVHFNKEKKWDVELKDFMSTYLPIYIKDMPEKEAKILLKKKYRELTKMERKDKASKPS